MGTKSQSGWAQAGNVVVALLLVLVLLPVLLPILAYLGARRAVLNLCIRLFWCARGKDVFYMSSDSPVFGPYMAGEILPLVRERAVMMNWSQRSRWPRASLATIVARDYARGKEFNPIVVLFAPFRRRNEFRFFRAFKRSKAGDTSELEALRRELQEALNRRG